MYCRYSPKFYLAAAGGISGSFRTDEITPGSPGAVQLLRREGSMGFPCQLTSKSCRTERALGTGHSQRRRHRRPAGGAAGLAMAQGLLVLKTRISEAYGLQAVHNCYAMKLA